MIEVRKKVQTVHVNLQNLYYSPLLSEKMQTAIILDIKTKMSWIKYLQYKDKDINIIVTQIPKFENKQKKLIKILQANRENEFIFSTLKNYYKKKEIILK